MASVSILFGVIRDVVSFLGVWGSVRDGSVSNFNGVVTLSEVEVGGRWAMSSRMDLRLAGWYMGVYFLRNFQFLSVRLPEIRLF